MGAKKKLWDYRVEDLVKAGGNCFCFLSPGPSPEEMSTQQLPLGNAGKLCRMLFFLAAQHQGIPP